MDFAAVATAIAGIASASVAAAVAAEIGRRMRRMRVGPLHIEFITTAEQAVRQEGLGLHPQASQVLKSFENISATEYAIDQETRNSVDGALERAIALLQQEVSEGDTEEPG